MGNMPLAQDTPGLDWSKYEAEILELFVTRNKTLKEVVKYMKKRHGFVARYVFDIPVPLIC